MVDNQTSKFMKSPVKPVIIYIVQKCCMDGVFSMQFTPEIIVMTFLPPSFMQCICHEKGILWKQFNPIMTSADCADGMTTTAAGFEKHWAGGESFYQPDRWEKNRNQHEWPGRVCEILRRRS